jgi:hypothetical protein
MAIINKTVKCDTAKNFKMEDFWEKRDVYSLQNAPPFLQLYQESSKQVAYCVRRAYGTITSAIKPVVLKAKLAKANFSCFCYIFMIMLQVVFGCACKNINTFTLADRKNSAG